MEPSSMDGRWEFDGREDLENVLTEHGLEKEDICLVGSISLSVRGLREHGDIDICIHPEKRHRIDAESLDGFIGVTEGRYENIELSDDELVEDDLYHDVIDGFKVVRPEITFSYKKLRDLPKDERDVELLEQYSQSTDDWDWELYRADYSQRPNSLVSRGFQSLRNDGLRVTTDKATGLLTRKFPIIKRTVNRLPIFDLQTPYQTVLRRKRTLTVPQLLNRQYAGNRFVGLDVVAYWAALDAYESDESPAFDTTKLDKDVKMLFDSDPTELEPLTVTQRHRVVQPAHFARLLHAGRDSVEVAFTFRSKTSGDEAWLREQGFTDDEISAISEQRIQLLDEKGVLFYVIFWPLTHEYHEQMEQKLGEKVSISRSSSREIHDIEGFVHDIYEAQTDTAPGWAIDWKAELMTQFPSTVRVATVELPNPRLRDGISREMEMVKNDVRHAFIEEFDDKHYLSLLHATDSFEDNLKAKAVIESYSN